MKTEDEIEKMRTKLAAQKLASPDYAQGVEDAFLWIIGDLSDTELLTGEEDD